MITKNLTIQLPENEKKKVAYALNLCAVSISQIIDNRDIVVLKQERESILSNLNLQNFVKHPALLEVIKQILDTLTYLEIQAGDLSFIEKEYQHNLKNAIWSAVPNPAILVTSGGPAQLALNTAVQIGTGYMNYRRNKSQYKIGKDRNEWELKKHEIEQLYGLREQLFETAWKLSSDYDFDDKYRLTQKQIMRYSEAISEHNPLKRFERLDVMQNEFGAFHPFWYYKGNAALEVFRDSKNQYGKISNAYRDEAINAYNNFHGNYFEFLREDIVAASCCLEQISLLEQNDDYINELLQLAMGYAGDNYDVLQQCVLVNLKLKKINESILPLRKMIANNYNTMMNGQFLSKIYSINDNVQEYEKLRLIVGKENVLDWNGETSNNKKLIDYKLSKLFDEFSNMTRKIKFILSNNRDTSKEMYDIYCNVLESILTYSMENKELKEAVEEVKKKFKLCIIDPDEKLIADFVKTSNKVNEIMKTSEFSQHIVEESDNLILNMKKIVTL